MRVFISYSHRQREWVRGRLVPCLRGARIEVLIDDVLMPVGAVVMGHMDAMQDAAETTLAVLTPDYLASGFCMHELNRALTMGQVVPVHREECGASLPGEVKARLWADLRTESDGEWQKVLDACGSDLGCAPGHWLQVRDQIGRLLERNQSVNLVVSGRPKWRGMIESLEPPIMPVVDLDNGAAASRPGLVELMVRSLGGSGAVPGMPDDLKFLSRFLDGKARARLALIHFERAKHRNYDVDLFSALRYEMEARRLVLLIESREPIGALVPREHPLSSLGATLVELQGR